MGLSTPSGGGGAPADAEYVTGSSNSELSNETVVSPAGDILTSGSFGSSVSLSPGFDTFVQVDATNPSIVHGTVFVKTDSTTAGFAKVQVDESGGTSPDYEHGFVLADSNESSSTVARGNFTIPLPAGAQFQINNVSDPLNFNAIDTLRATIITP